MTHILIVGQKFSGLSDYLIEHGFEYTLLMDAKKTKFPDKKFKNRIVVDFANYAELYETVDQLDQKKPIDGVIATYENYILDAAKIGEHLNLPHLPVASAEACTDKFLMRSLFAKIPEKISPGFAIVNNKNDVLDFAKNHDFPLILKPANLAKSLLVTRSDNLKELTENYAKTVSQIEKIYEKYAPNRQPKIIIEEFLEGSIHSVDAFTGGDGEPQILENIVDYQTGYDIGFDDNFHYSRILPSKLSQADQDALRNCAQLGIKALGMKNSPAHIEIIMTKNGPRIVEIGARNGGYRERMHKLAHGIDITGAGLALVRGEKPNVTAVRNDPCAVLELFPRTPGNFVGISNEDVLRDLESLNYFSVKAKTKQFVGKAGDGYKMCAVVILHNADQERFLADLNFINENVSVLTS